VSKQRARGTAWESAICRFLAPVFPSVERRALNGSKDRGDIAGLPQLVVEAKHVARLDLSGWLDEAETERDNDGARYGVVWLKRRGFTDPGRAYVLMSGDDFRRLYADAQGVET
jgi:hypothetical protein